MLKVYIDKGPNSRELSLEDRYPTDYLYHPSEAVKRLGQTLKELKELIESEKKVKRKK